MTLDLRPSRACLALVQRFEGYRGRAARLPGGGWTIGYGHTLTAREGAEVGPQDASALLLYDLTAAGEAVRELTYTPLNQNQFDALAAFAFNVGPDAFRGSDVLKRVNEGDVLGAASALERWRVAEFEGEAIVIDGLVRRRAAEKALFLTPPEGFRFVPTAVLRPTPDLAAPAADPRPAADVESPMSGDLAVAERVRPPETVAAVAADQPGPPAVETAAVAVSSRLQRLFPEPSHDIVAPLSDPAGEPYPPAELAPFPADVEDRAEPPPPPFPSAPSPEAVQPSEPLFPHAEAPAPALPSPPVVAAGDPFTRHRRPGAASPVTAGKPSGFAEEARGQPGPARRHAYGLVGLIGLALFAAAILWMLSGRAGTLNLLLGLAGVACMAPAGAALVLPLLHRGPDRG